MESLDPEACFVEDLLDFSSDIGEDDDDDHKKRPSSSTPILLGGHGRSLPVSFPLPCHGAEFSLEPDESRLGFPSPGTGFSFACLFFMLGFGPR